MHYVESGSVVRVLSEDDIKVHDSLQPYTYTVKYSDNMGFYLEKTSNLFNSGKTYGNQHIRSERILNTFSQKDCNVGVLLVGTKGSGKTHLTRLISQTALNVGIPTIIVNSKFESEDFLSFIKKINTSCVIVFDEFEKIYKKNNDEQKKLLTLLDGIYSSRHLYVFTANDYWGIDELFINRPGRIYYKFSFEGLDPDFIREYCNDNISNKSEIDSIVKLASTFTDFNFDMLKALVEEMNRYNESAFDVLEYLNINPTSEDPMYNFVVFDENGEEVKSFWPRSSKLNLFSPHGLGFEVNLPNDNEISFVITSHDMISYSSDNVVFKKSGYTINATPAKKAGSFDIRSVLAL